MMNTKQRAGRTSVGKWSTRLAVLAVGAGALGHAAPASASLFELSEQDEIKAGQQVAAQAQKEYGRALPPSDPMARRVAAIGRKLAALSTRRNIPFSYTVLQNEKVLNAFAAPGGPIFVTTKLMRTTSNDAELAYVLGHETGHIEQRHIAKAMAKQQKVGLGVGILGAILGRRAGGSAVNAVAGLAFNVWQSGYSRTQESEADAVGVRLMSRLGYDPRAAISMLHKLDGEGQNPGGLEKYLASHPAPAKRIVAVNAEIQRENLVEVARQNGGPRLSDNASYSAGSYANANDQYPDGNYSNRGASSNGGYASNQGSNADYPDYNGDARNGGRSNSGTQGTYSRGSDSQVADLGAPLRIVERGGDSIILASVRGVARWAGAGVRQSGNLTTLSRNGRRMELRRYSTVATVNGRTLEMSIAPNVFDGQLYAPLGDLVEGVGGSASFDEQLNAVRLQLDGRESTISLPR